MNILRRGNIVRTNYDTGPYVITDVDGPCLCPDRAPSEPHFHITCQFRGRPENGNYWLNGYREDGTNVWSGDRLFLVGHAAQQELFK